MSGPTIEIKRLAHGEGLQLPAYETPEAAGMDLRAALGEDETVTLKPGQSAMVPTGLSMAMPMGFEAQIRPRSGLAAKNGVTVLNTPGTIDSDYRGPLGVILLNTGQDAFGISHGDRIAQMVVSPVIQATFSIVEALDETQRGEGGFGATGQN